MIWLGEVIYLVQGAKLCIDNIFTIEDFRKQKARSKIGTAPILVTGGGNFGDIWSYYRDFYQELVQNYPNNEIIFLPQTLFFKYPEVQKRLRGIFSAHKKVTIFAREQISLDIARETFPNNRVLFAVDAAFALDGHLPKSSFSPGKYQQGLYLCRTDLEYNKVSSASSLALKTEDWLSYYDAKRKSLKTLSGLQDLWNMFRSGQQSPRQFLLRQWLRSHHPLAKFLSKLPLADFHLKSWNYILMGTQQLTPYTFVVTNRLHAHILCCLLRIPNLFLANSYHKNESFYRTNTQEADFCRFSSSNIDNEENIQSLLYRSDLAL